MKDLYEKWCSINLVLRIVIGLVLGTVLAIIIPNILFIEIIGELFVGAFSIGLEVPIVIAFALCFLATLAACGASGVSGGSLLLIPMACSLLGIGDDIAMQLVAVGFIIGVIQDSLETAINSSNDVLYTATAEVVDARKKGETFELNTD